MASRRRFSVYPLLLAVCLIPAAGVALHPAAANALPNCPWLGQSASADVRADEVIARMTLTEEIGLLGAPREGNEPYGNRVPGIPRLCIPAFTLEDGPAGVAGPKSGVTQLPAPIALSATWDVGMAGDYGAVQGSEARGEGADVIQGPDVNLSRVPTGGRVWEMYGEDPYLTGHLAVADITGIQRQGVMAMAKHYVANDQEAGRIGLDVRVDERVLHELYLRPFETAVQDGHVASTMCALNKINGLFACDHEALLSSVLKGQWGFAGFTRSDLGAAFGHTVAAYNAGMDWMKAADPVGLTAAVRAGQVHKSRLDDAVHRILRQMFAYDVIDHPPSGTFGSVVTSPEHVATARAVAEEGTVLLKNGGDLPLDPAMLKSIAVIGPDGGDGAHTAGKGSAHVNAPQVVTPFFGLTERAGPDISVRYAAGLPDDIPAAAQLAARSSVAVVFANDTEAEGSDRPNLSLPDKQDDLISAVAAANPRTIVVLNTGGPVLMPWLDKVSGVLEAWYPGQTDGIAAAALLFGDVDPSGKLPVTFPASPSQTPTTPLSRHTAPNNTIVYGEGLQMGYRWYDAHHVDPLYPFGYGLSYTTFRASGLTVAPNASSGAIVSADVTNTGHRTGRATLQVYVGQPPAAAEPPRQLAAFAKTADLGPGATTNVRLAVPAKAFEHWDTTRREWVGTAGAYTIWAGTSSRNLPLHTTIRPQLSGSPPWLVAYRGSDGSLYSRQSDDVPGSTDRALSSPDGRGLSSSPAVAIAPSGRVYYVAAGTNHALYVRTTLTGWTRLVDSASNYCTQPGAAVAGSQLVFGCEGRGAGIYVATAALPTAPGNPHVAVMTEAAHGARSGPAVYVTAGTIHLTFLGSPFSDGNTYDRTLSAPGRHLAMTCAGQPAAAAAGTRWFACRSPGGGLTYRREGTTGATTGTIGTIAGTPGLAINSGDDVTAGYAGTNKAVYTRVITTAGADRSHQVSAGSAMSGVATSRPPG